MGVGAGQFAPFLFLGPPRAVYMSPPRCLTYSLGLAGCSVGRGISRGARKLARTPTLSKKKKRFTAMCNTLSARVMGEAEMIPRASTCKIKR